MLQTDPMKRATAADIHKHEWFLKDLATYLFPDRDIDVALIDTEALESVCEKFSVQPSEVKEILENGDYQNPLAIAYRLIIDNKRIEGEHAMEEFRLKFSKIVNWISWLMVTFFTGSSWLPLNADRPMLRILSITKHPQAAKMALFVFILSELLVSYMNIFNSKATHFFQNSAHLQPASLWDPGNNAIVDPHANKWEGEPMLTNTCFQNGPIRWQYFQ